MKDSYKGCNIIYLENIEEFEAQIGESSYQNKSLSVVKKYIDNLEKKDFKRVDVIVNDYTGYKYGTITSCVESNHYGGHKGIDCWISLKKGSRKKMNIENVYLDNTENRAIIGKIIVKKEEVNDIQAKIQKLRSSFEGYKTEINHQ